MTIETTRMIRSEELLEADVNGEIVALHIEKGQCYGLNGVASRIWSMLSEPASIDDICTTLVGEYEVDPATCRADVGTLLSDLRSEGLIKSVQE